jgi:5-methylthioribose kinase
LDYDLLDESSVPSYVAAQPHLAARVDTSTLRVREVGDGNLNLVFICFDDAGASLALKQSLPYVRVAPDWQLTADRSIHEWIGLREAYDAAPDTSPEVYGYDAPQHVVAMQDLSELRVWRTALNGGHIARGTEELCGQHIARLTFATSLHGRSAMDYRRGVAEATNPELCDITEELVFTEPFIEHEHNVYDERLGPVVSRLSSNGSLRAEVSRLKVEFMTRTDGLLHGDLHTGSIMIGSTGSEIKTFDTEFGTYGPTAFDLGVLVANMALAHARASVLGRTEQSEWLAEFPFGLWAAFSKELRILWADRADRSFGDEIVNEWLARTQRDMVGFAGCEVIRRIVGFAKVSDIETLERDDHITAAGAALGVAERFLTRPPVSIGPDLFDL